MSALSWGRQVQRSTAECFLLIRELDGPSGASYFSGNRRRCAHNAHHHKKADLIAAEQATAAEAALAALAPHLREALLLHIIEGLTQPEAAKRLGVSRRTLQRYIETALAQMALALAEPDT